MLDQGLIAAPLLEHLLELRRRVLRSFAAVGLGFILCYAVKERLFDALVSPLVSRLDGGQLIYTSLGELFFAYLKISLWGGMMLAAPVILWQVWAFCSPGLYRREKQFVVPLVFGSTLLFYLAVLFSFFVFLPFVIDFLLTFETASVAMLPSVKEYLSFLLGMSLAFGVAFELPVAMILLIRTGLVSRETFAAGRRYAIVAIFIIAAILTPPDPLSQILLAVPMVILYEIGLVGAWLMDRLSRTEEAKTTD